MDQRRQWLPWRPRVRLVWFWTGGIKRLYRVINTNQQWFNARFRGKALIVGLPLFLFVSFSIGIVGVALVAEITIFPFAASIYAAFGEWLLLVLLCPFVLVGRFVLRRPWPTIDRNRSRRVIWP
jgi:hypothetical protein